MRRWLAAGILVLAACGGSGGTKSTNSAEPSIQQRLAQTTDCDQLKALRLEAQRRIPPGTGSSRLADLARTDLINVLAKESSLGCPDYPFASGASAPPSTAN